MDNVEKLARLFSKKMMGEFGIKRMCKINQVNALRGEGWPCSSWAYCSSSKVEAIFSESYKEVYGKVLTLDDTFDKDLSKGLARINNFYVKDMK